MVDKTKPVASADLGNEEKRRGKLVKAKLYFQYEDGHQKMEEIIPKGDNSDPAVIAFGPEALKKLKLGDAEHKEAVSLMHSRGVDTSGQFIPEATMNAYLSIDGNGKLAAGCSDEAHKPPS